MRKRAGPKKGPRSTGGEKLANGELQAVLPGRGLRYAAQDDLIIRRKRAGRGFSFVAANERPIRDARTVRRLQSLAVPPAYEEVRYAADPSAHIQAVGRDAAGRLQYRYHPEWEKLREARKGRRMVRLVASLPRIRRGIRRDLAHAAPVRELALAACADLAARTAIRAGGEEYWRSNGTRGAATLLKTDVRISGPWIRLKFRGKANREIEKSVKAPRLAEALRRLMQVSGRRLFQYVDGEEVRMLRSADINAYLRSLAGAGISLKDFRTLTASSAALAILARLTPARSKRQRRRQLREAIGTVAEELVNTPAIARRSYVDDAIIEAFESGRLARLRRNGRNGGGSMTLLAKIVQEAGSQPSHPPPRSGGGAMRSMAEGARST